SAFALCLNRVQHLRSLIATKHRDVVNRKPRRELKLGVRQLLLVTLAACAAMLAIQVAQADGFYGAGSSSSSHGFAGETGTLLSDGKVLITGGDFGSANAELYDPRIGVWSLLPGMSVGRYNHTATLLLNGTVLVAGGVGRASAEIY